MAKNAINVEVEPRRNEAIERTLKRFTKKVKKEKILEEYRNRMYYEKPSSKRRRKKLRAKELARRAQKENQLELDKKR